MGFESYHPAINFLYFTAAIVCTIWFDHPVFVAISWFCAFMYSVKRNGMRALFFNLGLLILAVAYTGWYSYYHHFGVTKLATNFVGNTITLESVLFGLERGISFITVVMFLSCVFSVVSSDKVVYLFGRISPKLSLFLSILLRSVRGLKSKEEKSARQEQESGKAVRMERY